MPANLTQQYLKAEQRYREATTAAEELACLQEMLKEIPKHKGTDKLQADLKQKISRLRDEVAKAKPTASKSPMAIPKQGAGRGVILGGPNSGKSSLLAAITRATPEIAAYPFTTREPQPGMMPWQDVAVQLIDTPPITVDVFDPAIQGLVRGADVALLMLDLGSDDGGDELNAVLSQFGNTKTRFGAETCLDPEDVGVTYTQTFLVANKWDDPSAQDRWDFFRETSNWAFRTFFVSCKTGAGLGDLKDAIFAATNSIRIYTKSPTKKEADRDKPFTLKQGSTLLELAELIHRDLAENFKNARVWGTHIHPGSQVKGDYVLHDGDVVEIHT